MKTLKEFLSEGVKSMSLKKIMQKINDGQWESSTDVVKGKHVDMTDHKGKKFTVYVENAGADGIKGTDDDEEYDESCDDDLEEKAVKHSTSKEKALAKKKRNTPAGKKAAKLSKIKRSKASFRPDPKRSKIAAKAAKHRR